MERILGPPDRFDNTYDSGNATVSFFYSFGPCELAEDDRRWDVRLDVVVAIRVWPTVKTARPTASPFSLLTGDWDGQ